MVDNYEIASDVVVLAVGGRLGFDFNLGVVLGGRCGIRRLVGLASHRQETETTIGILLVGLSWVCFLQAFEFSGYGLTFKS
ncbi:hypothetical protein ACLB2K_008153 [Fragaria x ananassa]